jgi:hypothetical protein
VVEHLPNNPNVKGSSTGSASVLREKCPPKILIKSFDCTGSLVVKFLFHNPKVKGLSPASAASTERKNAKMLKSKTLPVTLAHLEPLSHNPLSRVHSCTVTPACNGTRNCQRGSTYFASSSSTVVKHLPNNPNVKGSSTGTASALREKMPKCFNSKTLPVPVAQW